MPDEAAETEVDPSRKPVGLAHLCLFLCRRSQSLKGQLVVVETAVAEQVAV